MVTNPVTREYVFTENKITREYPEVCRVTVFVAKDCIGQDAWPILISTLCRLLRTHIVSLEGLRNNFGGQHKLHGQYICCGHQNLDELYCAQLFFKVSENTVPMT